MFYTNLLAAVKEALDNKILISDFLINNSVQNIREMSNTYRSLGSIQAFLTYLEEMSYKELNGIEASSSGCFFTAGGY